MAMNNYNPHGKVLLAIDPGITATKGDLPDLGKLLDVINSEIGPIGKSLAYVTYQPLEWVGTELDDGSDPRRDGFNTFLQKVGYSDVSRVHSTPGDHGTVKCNVDTSIIKDVWNSLITGRNDFSPITGYYNRYSTAVLVTGDWDIIRPLVLNERDKGHQSTLMDLGVRVIVMYKEGCTNRRILDLARNGVIDFIPLERYRTELTNNRRKRNNVSTP